VSPCPRVPVSPCPNVSVSPCPRVFVPQYPVPSCSLVPLFPCPSVPVSPEPEPEPDFKDGYPARSGFSRNSGWFLDSQRRYMFFDQGEDLEHGSILYHVVTPTVVLLSSWRYRGSRALVRGGSYNVPCSESDIKLWKYLESIYNQRKGLLTR